MTRYALLVRGINVGGKNKGRHGGNFVKNWQTWDWKRLKATSTVATFSLLDCSKSPIGWKVRGFLYSPLSIYSELFFAESRRLWSRSGESTSLVEWRLGYEKRCPLLHWAFGCGASHHDSWEFRAERWGRSFWKTWDFLKNPTLRLPITSTCSRCLSTAILLFVMLKTFDKIGQMLKK